MFAMKKLTDMKFLFKMNINLLKNNKGLSAVIATLMLILLTLVIVGILWAVVTGVFDDQMQNTKNCFGNFEKVTMNEQYTCYNGSDKTLLVSLSIGEIEVDEVIISVADVGTQKSFTIKKDLSSVDNVWPLGGNEGDQVKLPGEFEGRTYIINITAEGFISRPDMIEIAPRIGEDLCDVSDSTNEIFYCTAVFP